MTMPRVFRLVSGQNQHKRDPQTKRQQTLAIIKYDLLAYTAELSFYDFRSEIQ
ncbi:hypothetical protein [Deefgea sp. CFH1-16]|uniref:hypothetical protein n=1 Tax=Deefgea sp. CFH1-16 TaxID=2675457 RepID=UPI0015F72696|nr:hypothetical protein [Deefgea sp. CFH1-16]MBM5574729.1 hypothetical protein [Deefgea sp. CFH1-16]